MSLKDRLWQALTPDDVKQELEAFREAARSFLDMQLDEPGYELLGQAGAEAQIDRAINRTGRNLEARYLYHVEPVARQVVTLHNAYTFGRGVAVSSQDAQTAGVIRSFWDDMRNRETFTRALPQWLLNRDQQLEGEIDLLLGVSTLDGRVTIRPLPSTEVQEAIYTEDDPIIPAYYRRFYRPRRYDFSSHQYVPADQPVRSYIPDWRWAEADQSKIPNLPEKTEYYLMRVVTNPLNTRGISQMSSALPWMKALRGFMEDRVTLTLALATFAFKAKVKGNKAAIRRLEDRFGEWETQYKYGHDTRERRQGANIAIENEAMDLEQFKVDSGANQAYTDARMLRQQAGLGGGGIFEHYLGDPSTGNLATATAMELPMLKLFEYEQQMWQDVISDVIMFVLIQAMRFNRLPGGLDIDRAGGLPVWTINDPDGDLDFEVKMPNIVKADFNVYATGIAQLKQAESIAGHQIIPPRETALAVLRMLDFGQEASEIVSDMEADDFSLPSSPVDLGSQLGEALLSRYGADIAQVLTEADPKKGDVPSTKEIRKTGRILKSEVLAAFDDFEDLPDIDAFLDRIGATRQSVREGNGHAGTA